MSGIAKTEQPRLKCSPLNWAFPDMRAASLTETWQKQYSVFKGLVDPNDWKSLLSSAYMAGFGA